MATRLQSVARRLGPSSVTGFTSRGIHASVLLSPIIAQKEQAKRSTAVGKSIETLLQEAEDRLRNQIEVSRQSRQEQSLKNVSAATKRAVASVLPGLREKLLSGDPEAQLNGAKECRKLLSDDGDAPILEMVSAGFVRPLVELLESNRSAVQLEAAWALTNIASGLGTPAREVVAQGGVPSLVGLLSSDNAAVREQAVWALGNIAGDSIELRDVVISGGVLQPVSDIFNETANDGSPLARTAAWVLANLCRGVPAPSLDLVKPSLSVLDRMLRASDEEVVEQACWAYAYLTANSEEHISAIVQVGACQTLTELLMHTNINVQIPALRALGNIAAGTDEQTEAVVQCGVLPILSTLVQHESEKLNKGACWMLSNIVAGCSASIPQILDCGIMQSVVKLVQSGDAELRKEATWALGNMIMKGNQPHIDKLVEHGCVTSIAELLHVFDQQTSLRLLAALEKILHVGMDLQKEKALVSNPYATLVEQACGRGKIEAFQADGDVDVRKLAHKIASYF